MKKILAFVLTLAIAVTAFGQTTFAASSWQAVGEEINP
jgi:hypothetical protein